MTRKAIGTFFFTSLVAINMVWTNITVRASFLGTANRHFLFSRAPLKIPTPLFKGSVCRYIASSPRSDGGEKHLTRDPRTLGSAKVPFTWAQLKDLVQNDQLDKMSRSRSEQDRYEEYILKIRSEWLSVVDHILCSKFDFEKEKVVVNGIDKWRSHPSLEEVNFVKKSLRLNDFPYYVEDNVQHWCLWKLKDNVDVDDISFARKELYKALDVEEFIHFVNPPHLKSIPEIDHAHIFVRLEANA
mmetsp:Transcript_2743/g.3827  ORF Transcript_2743/g.3827 Transcript_2743/m.3827 type:complete len:243 (-) Transcript_2743:1303-2031(-)